METSESQVSHKREITVTGPRQCMKILLAFGLAEVRFAFVSSQRTCLPVSKRGLLKQIQRSPKVGY